MHSPSKEFDTSSIQSVGSSAGPAISAGLCKVCRRFLLLTRSSGCYPMAHQVGQGWCCGKRGRFGNCRNTVPVGNGRVVIKKTKKRIFIIGQHRMEMEVPGHHELSWVLRLQVMALVHDDPRSEREPTVRYPPRSGRLYKVSVGNLLSLFSLSSLLFFEFCLYLISFLSFSLSFHVSPFSWGGQAGGHSVPRVGAAALGNDLSATSGEDGCSLLLPLFL